MLMVFVCVFFFKQKTAYEMRISDWSSDVCSSDLQRRMVGGDRDDDRFLADFGGQLGFDEIADLAAALADQADDDDVAFGARDHQIGRASWRERVCQYV